MTDEQLTRLLRELLGPVNVEQQQAEAQARTELRDRFAGYALIGLLAAGDAHAYNRDEMAAEAWKQADAMMKERGHE
jgi:predicted negative regulator of RcsB-dependent stress response